jgi:hypothetical protein
MYSVHAAVKLSSENGSPGIRPDVTRTVCGSDGKENEVRLEDEFRDAMLEADEFQWIEQVRPSA